MKKVIVTGAGGFIGGAVTQKLLNDGVIVYGIDISDDKVNKFKHYDNFVPVVADFTLYDKLDTLIDERRFDCFFHFAWQGVFGDAFKDYSLQLSNAKYACDAICAAKRLECSKFVMAGTYNEYEIKTFINSENFYPRYTCIYSTAKTAAELICKTIAYNNDIEYSAGLIAMAYGEGNFSKMLPNILISQLLSGITPKLIEGNVPYDMIYIDDIANAFIAIAKNGKNLKSYYVGHRNLKSFRKIITDIRDVIDPQAELAFGAYHDTTNRDYSLIDLDALYNDTGFECKADFKESILKTAEWVKTLNCEEK